MNKINTKNIKYLKSKRFLIGFEVEMCLDRIKLTVKEFKKIIKDLNKDIIIGNDGSIIPVDYHNHSTFELKTPPLSSLKSFKLLSKIFDVIEKYGYTNETTGLHVNISPICKKLYYSINPIYIASHPLFEKIVKDFNREDNEFCVTYSKEDFKSEPVKNNIDFWHRNVGECCYNYDPLVINPDYYGHSSAVNFDNYHTKKSKDSRLEIRAFGNTNYHKKLDKVLKHTDEIIKVYLQSQKVKLHIK
jgi:hypothetical protein